MALYQFKLPDIGEGIAEAEIVAWHVKVGDTVKEDQQLADMMTDKATVEMESPVAGKVVRIAGEVGDQIAIGSVLVEFEVEGDAPAEQASDPAQAERNDSVALGDGLVEPTPAQEEAVPSLEEKREGERRQAPRRSEEREGIEHRTGEDRRAEAAAPIAAPAPEARQSAQVLASPAVRQRARDLGIHLAQVKTSGDRIRHSDLDAYLLYNGGGAPSRP
ncbi:MAG TPA: biotin/lipoyl-containing protein, partial [Allosphingosinicella sp.]|uniref:biotin/lipoyl-containing protein n=1 Tax=Allosphingosinicella sp. TaxID=2823234 RepID=UPI002EDAC398